MIVTAFNVKRKVYQPLRHRDTKGSANPDKALAGSHLSFLP